MRLVAIFRLVIERRNTLCYYFDVVNVCGLRMIILKLKYLFNYTTLILIMQYIVLLLN